MKIGSTSRQKLDRRLDRRAGLRPDEEGDLALLVGEERRAIDRANAAVLGVPLGDAEDERVRLSLGQPGLLSAAQSVTVRAIGS